MSKVNIVLDATLLDTFVACPTKFNYRHNMNRVPTVKPKPLDKGGLIHVGYEKYYHLLAAGKPFNDCLNAAILATRTSLATDSDLSLEEGNFIVNTVEESLTYWRVADQGFQINAVETPFSYVLYEDETFRIVMIGKIDLLITDNRYENLPVDHKSFQRDFPVHRKTNQFCNYANALKSNYLLVNRVGLQTSLKPHEKYKRVPLSYDPAFLKQWESNVIKWCMRYYDCVESNDWPMNDTSCDKFNRLCEYYEICDTSGEENKLYKLNVDFKQDKPWDVSRILAQKGE